MFKFLRHSAAPHEATDSRPSPAPAPSQSAPLSSGTSSRNHTDIQRELIRVVLKDTLRRNGIPFEWLQCEVVTIVHGKNSEELQIQLVLMQWQELFLRYAPALEHQLLRGLDRFEPAVDHSKYTISWRFSPDCGCPFTVMPPSVVWAHKPAAEPVEEDAPAILDRRHTKRAPNTAAGALSTPPRRDGDSGEYERTELSPFR